MIPRGIRYEPGGNKWKMLHELSAQWDRMESKNVCIFFRPNRITGFCWPTYFEMDPFYSPFLLGFLARPPLLTQEEQSCLKCNGFAPNAFRSSINTQVFSLPLRNSAEFNASLGNSHLNWKTVTSSSRWVLSISNSVAKIDLSPSISHILLFLQIAPSMMVRRAPANSRPTFSSVLWPYF